MAIGLKRKIDWVRLDDLKHPESSISEADELIVGYLKKNFMSLYRHLFKFSITILSYISRPLGSSHQNL
jgi:hypothetical protein